MEDTVALPARVGHTHPREVIVDDVCEPEVRRFEAPNTVVLRERSYRTMVSGPAHRLHPRHISGACCMLHVKTSPAPTRARILGIENSATESHAEEQHYSKAVIVPHEEYKSTLTLANEQCSGVM